MDDLIEAMLPTYREWRSRWPCWTGNASSWSGEARPDRMHWSAERLLLEIGERLIRALPGYAVTNFLTPNLNYAAFKPGTLGPAPTLPSPFYPYPALFRLHVLAVCAQFSNPVPESSDKIVVPRLTTEGHDEEDLASLGDRVTAELRTVRDNSPETLAQRFARHHAERSAGVKTTETEADLALELVRRIGLTVAHPRNAKNTISPAVLKCLRTETRDIVRQARTYKVAREDMLSLGNLIAEDKQMEVNDKSAFDEMLWMLDRSKKHGGPKTEGSWIWLEALHLRFSFLTRDELSTVLWADGSVVDIADTVLLARLPADITVQTLRSSLSRAR